MQYGERIKRYRELRGLTQDELARQAQIPSTAISRLEHGSRKITLEEAVRVADALGIQLEDLAGVSSAHDQGVLQMLVVESIRRLRGIPATLSEVLHNLESAVAGPTTSGGSSVTVCPPRLFSRAVWLCT